MKDWFYVLLIFILFLIWLRIDFISGQRKQRQEAKKSTQVTHQSQLELLPIGDIFFERLFHDMKQATDHIHFLFYIFRDDHIGNKFVQLLEDKAREGITVRVLVDRIGSDLPNKKIKQLKKSRCSFCLFSSSSVALFVFYTK